MLFLRSFEQPLTNMRPAMRKEAENLCINNRVVVISCVGALDLAHSGSIEDHYPKESLMNQLLPCWNKITLITPISNA
jgi:hypothetical protein